MKIGILGGTFNPVHNSHIYLAEQYTRHLSLDRVLFIPSCLPPHKRADDLAEASDRLAMCRLAVKNYPFFEVLDYEINAGGFSYTYKTLEYLAALYPDTELCLLMGADMFLTVQDWKNPPQIFRLATLCAAARETGEFELMKAHEKSLSAMGARCIILQIEPKPLSSTKIRKRIHAGEDVGPFLPSRVWQYIRENSIYNTSHKI